MGSQRCASFSTTSGPATSAGSRPLPSAPGDTDPAVTDREPYETEIDIDAPPDIVYRHLTQPESLTAGMGEHAILEPVPGGKFEVDIAGTPMRGRYLEAAPHRVVVTWGIAGSDDLPPGSTEVEFTLEAVGQGTRLHLVHRN